MIAAFFATKAGRLFLGIIAFIGAFAAAFKAGEFSNDADRDAEEAQDRADSLVIKKDIEDEVSSDSDYVRKRDRLRPKG